MNYYKLKFAQVIKLTTSIFLWIYLIYLIFFLIFEYEPTSNRYNPPFVIWIIDLINLFIHEAGHFFFKIFGKISYFLGGSLMQIILPFALFIISYRKNPISSFLPAFWTGESMINVSKYIQDAPFRQLKLISKNLIHDWNWILKNNLELAEPIYITVFVVGLMFCFISVGILGYYILKNILKNNCNKVFFFVNL